MMERLWHYRNERLAALLKLLSRIRLKPSTWTELHLALVHGHAIGNAAFDRTLAIAKKRRLVMKTGRHYELTVKGCAVLDYLANMKETLLTAYEWKKNGRFGLSPQG